ncbi:MAG: XRE family transcriptional regulator [Mariprofundaceae bacterium]|nr:XRE family transcriptional regulator [Mariprofundaceae bacterium]
MKNKHIGSGFDDFMEEEGLLIESEAIAIKRVIAYQLEKEMARKHLSKAAMARSMKTSRSALDRLLDPNNSSVTLKTLDAAAHVLGKRVHLSLV